MLPNLSLKSISAQGVVSSDIWLEHFHKTDYIAKGTFSRSLALNPKQGISEELNSLFVSVKELIQRLNDDRIKFKKLREEADEKNKKLKDLIKKINDHNKKLNDPDKKYCEICDIYIHRASMSKDLKSKKHLNNEDQTNIMNQPTTSNEDIRNNPKSLKELARDKIELDYKELNKEIT